ncbi:MAG: phosphate/phosphite/phosphonate ABC transporter substrate-binding protein [Candidatus Thiodiazotropha sp.]
MRINLPAVLVLLFFSVLNLSVQAGQEVFTVGVVPQFEARKLHAIWRPILDRLEQSTGYRFELRGSPTIPEFEREFMAGVYDFAYMNPYHLVIANEKTGYVPLIRDQARRLYGVLVVSKESDIKSPGDLDGKIVAFPAPNALGASLMMRQELSDRFKVNITPYYVKTHDSVYLNVLLKKASAGGGVQKTLNRQKQEYRDHLLVIHETEKVAPHPFVAHPRVAEEIRQLIQDALLEIGNSDEGRALLAKIPMKQVGKATLSDYEPLTKMGLERFYVAP